MEVKTGTWTEKKGLAQMLKGGRQPTTTQGIFPVC